ncbi:transmembrane protein, putative [Medicago truncatula]|uniref:Transmembrane protein, putative n=1 Tax=Medicago truncatula TaxID=3880 RepID=A0A072TY08_MEDTR|nr:transmembrane protein, putative [Medicago truncatula]
MCNFCGHFYGAVKKLTFLKKLFFLANRISWWWTVAAVFRLFLVAVFCLLTVVPSLGVVLAAAAACFPLGQQHVAVVGILSVGKSFSLCGVCMGLRCWLIYGTFVIFLTILQLVRLVRVCFSIKFANSKK